MSGGFFGYKQHYIQDLIEQLQETLIRLDLEPIPDTWECNSLKPYVEDIDLIKQVIKKDIEVLKQAYIYTQGLDWYLSGDDSLKSFKERLLEDFQKQGLKHKVPYKILQKLTEK